MGLFVSTVSASVTIPELGITITHPITDFNVGAQFDSKDVENAFTLTSAIQAGTLTWRKTAGGTIESPASYDADWLRIDELNTGTPIQVPTSQIPDFATAFATLLANTFQIKATSTVLTNATSATLTSITELRFAVVTGKKYLLEVWVLYRTPRTTTGIGLSVSTPAGVVSGIVKSTINAADGTTKNFVGDITSSGDTVTSSGVSTANTTFLSKMEVVVIPTANGNITPQFRTEVNGQTVSLQAGSFARLSVV